MTRRCRELLIAACALPALLAAARAQTDRVPPAPGLFGPDEPLALTLTTNLKAVMKDRGSQSPYHAATLSYADPDGAPVSLAIRVKTRGLFRLKPTTCQFPPLMLHFPKKQAAHTVFASQEKLKLVTHCQNRRDEYEQYVVEEYLIYRMYNLLTERSLRVRLTRMTYADSGGRDAPLTKYGFLLEDDREMAARSRIHASRASRCGSGCPGARAGRPKRLTHCSRGSGPRRTRATRCTGASGRCRPSAPSRRCGITTTSTRPSATRGRSSTSFSGPAATRPRRASGATRPRAHSPQADGTSSL